MGLFKKKVQSIVVECNHNMCSPRVQTERSFANVHDELDKIYHETSIRKVELNNLEAYVHAAIGALQEHVAEVVDNLLKPEEPKDVRQTFNGYCIKCREKQDFKGTIITSDSGRRMAQGYCPVCNTKMNRILGKA